MFMEEEVRHAQTTASPRGGSQPRRGQMPPLSGRVKLLLLSMEDAAKVSADGGMPTAFPATDATAIATAYPVNRAQPAFIQVSRWYHWLCESWEILFYWPLLRVRVPCSARFHFPQGLRARELDDVQGLRTAVCSHGTTWNEDVFPM